MKQLKKTLLTLVALLAVTTGAWADDTYTIKFEANGNSKTVENVTLPHTFSCDYSGVNGELDQIIKQLYGLSGGCCSQLSPGASGNSNVTAGMNGDNQFITISAPFEGNATVTGSYFDAVYNDFDYSLTISCPGYAPAASSAFDVDWNKAEKTGTFTMPGGNVTLEPEYYPQATLAFQGLTAAEDAAAKTEAPLAVVADGAVTGGTLMYYVATDKNFSQADAIALAETQWSAAIPTAETVEAAGTCYVWYYIKGDAEHSDTDPVPLVVTLLPEPTYTVEFAEGTPESDKWTAEPATGVTKGTPVTVTYTGSKKVIGVKAEEKAKAPAYTLLSAATTSDYGKVVCAAGHLHDAKTAVPDGCTAVGILGKVTETGHGLILALKDATAQNWNTINGWTSVTTYAGTTLKLLPDDAARGINLTSYTTLGATTVSNWAMAQKSDYNTIFTNLGSTKSDSDGTTYDDNVNAFITTGVGGTAISGPYWSATVHGGNYGWYFYSNYWDRCTKTVSCSVRPVLGF